MNELKEIVFHLSADPAKRERQRKAIRRRMKAIQDACDNKTKTFERNGD